MHIEKKELPECLKRARPSGWSCDIADGIYLFQFLIVGMAVTHSICARIYYK